MRMPEKISAMMKTVRVKGDTAMVAIECTPEMAANFAAAYTKAGGSITFHKFEGQPHAFIPRDPASPDSLRALALITDFIHHQAR